MESAILEEDLKILGSDSIRESCSHFMLDMERLGDKNEEQEEEYTEPAIELDRVYNDMREIRSAAIEYGRRHKFAVSTLRSGARQLVLACKHSGSYRGTKKTVFVDEEPTQEANALPTVVLQQELDHEQVELFPRKMTRRKVSRKIQCPFQIRAKPIKGGQWIVYKMILEHNHPMATDSKAYAQHRKLDDETQKEIVRLMRENKTNTQIVKFLSDNGIRNVVRKDIANLRQTHFNPNSNKLSATGNILYQVEPPMEKLTPNVEPEDLVAQKLEAQQVAEVTEAFNLFNKSNLNGIARNPI